MHVLLKFDNAKHRSSLSKELEIGENYIECANFVAYAQYLIHKNDKKKYQYRIEDIATNMKEEILSAIKLKGDYKREETNRILNYILENKIRTFRELVFWAKEQGLLNEITKNEKNLPTFSTKIH